MYVPTTPFRNIDYPRLCYYPCLLARCPANNAKEENVKLIEISFVSWFSRLLGQVQKLAEIINTNTFNGGITDNGHKMVKFQFFTDQIKS